MRDEADDTLLSLLDRAACSDRGVRFMDRSGNGCYVGYAKLRERAFRTAGRLRNLGVSPGDRVAMILPTAAEFYDAFFGSLLAGALPAPLPPPVRLGRLSEYHQRTASLLRGCGARLVLTDVRTRRVLGRSVAAARPDLGCRTIDELPVGGVGSPRDVQPAPQDTAYIQHSSGTTGEPRPIRLTHAGVIANVRAIRLRILAAYPEDDTAPHSAVGWLPLHHDMGLVGCVITSLAQPVGLVLIPPELFVRRPATWLRTIARYRATVSVAPNFAYGVCADRIADEELAASDLSCWKVALIGAESVTPRTLKRFRKRFEPFGLPGSALTPVYGLAEATLAVTFSDPGASCRQDTFDRDRLAEGRAVPSDDGETLVSVGSPLAGFAIRIAGDGGSRPGPAKPLEERSLGRVLVRGPSLMEGYHGLPRETEAVLADGWLDTGDVGFIHDGELFLYGRRKDVIVLRGCKYAPQQLEHALEGLPGVRTGCAAAVGVVPEGGDSEQLTLLVERARDRSSGGDGDLAGRVRRRIIESTGLVPATVRILEPGTLPRTSSGKIRRAEARRLLVAGGLAPPNRVTSLTLLRESARSRLDLALHRFRRGSAGTPRA